MGMKIKYLTIFGKLFKIDICVKLLSNQQILISKNIGQTEPIQNKGLMFQNNIPKLDKFRHRKEEEVHCHGDKAIFFDKQVFFGLDMSIQIF